MVLAAQSLKEEHTAVLAHRWVRQAMASEQNWPIIQVDLED